jgi:hypothetical protein
MIFDNYIIFQTGSLIFFSQCIKFMPNKVSLYETRNFDLELLRVVLRIFVSSVAVSVDFCWAPVPADQSFLL